MINLTIKEGFKEVFRDAYIGDPVWSPQYGEGRIIRADEKSEFPVSVKFSLLDKLIWYNYAGLETQYSQYPTLFYAMYKPYRIVERPKPEIDWFKVPSGTRVVVSSKDMKDAKEARIFAVYLPCKENMYTCFSEGAYQCDAVSLEDWFRCTIHPDVPIDNAWLKDI